MEMSTTPGPPPSGIATAATKAPRIGVACRPTTRAEETPGWTIDRASARHARGRLRTHSDWSDLSTCSSHDSQAVPRTSGTRGDSRPETEGDPPLDSGGAPPPRGLPVGAQLTNRTVPSTPASCDPNRRLHKSPTRRVPSTQAPCDPSRRLQRSPTRRVPRTPASCDPNRRLHKSPTRRVPSTPAPCDPSRRLQRSPTRRVPGTLAFGSLAGQKKQS
jgi:hypothetical protein